MFIRFNGPLQRWNSEVDNAPWDCFRGSKQNSPVMHCQPRYFHTTEKLNLIDVANEFEGHDESRKRNFGKFVEFDFDTD